jgi:hypothetical protein
MPDFGSATFSQTDASNATGTMPSWSGAAAPSTLDDAGRALQGAVTREWNWRSYTLTAGGTADAKTLTYSVAPAAYYNGQRFAFINGTVNTTTVTLNVNSLGAKNVRKMVNGTATALAARDMPAGAYVEVAYNTSGDYFVWLNRDLTMTVPDNSSFLRNRILNGDMRIDQRNAGGAIVPTASAYSVDRWQLQITQASKVSIQQQGAAGGAGFTNSLAMTTQVTVPSPGATDYFSLRQGIEGFNVSDFEWGTANARTVTLSFWVQSSLTGTFGGSLTNNDNTRSYPFTYTISAASTWERKTITIAGPTTGTWQTTSSTGVNLWFTLCCGSTYTGTAGAWASTLLLQATGATNVLNTLSASLIITGVQLEAGSVATPFERRLYGQELALCQRYYEVGTAYNLFSGNTTAASIYYLPIRFSVAKRAAPTVGGADVANSGFSAGLPTFAQISADGFYASKAAASTLSAAYFQFSWTAAVEL